MAKKFNFEKTDNFYNDLATRESSGRNKVINPWGYLGLFQMGEGALVDTKYYYEKPLKIGQKPGSQYNNDWTGKWKGKNKIQSKEDFLSNPLVQEIAVREYHKIIWSYLKTHHKHEGEEIRNIVLTKSGMLAAGHLIGHSGLKKFIDSKGAIDPVDGNKIPCSSYLKEFGGYAVDYSIDKLMEDLKEFQMAGDNDTSEYSDSDAERGDEFGGTFGANKVINAKVNKLLSNPELLNDHQMKSMNEVMEELKLADTIIPGLSKHSLAFAQENQEFLRQFTYPAHFNVSEEDFADIAGMNFQTSAQNELNEDPEFYANLGVIADFDNLTRQHMDLMGQTLNQAFNWSGYSSDNEDQENCLIS